MKVLYKIIVSSLFFVFLAGHVTSQTMRGALDGAVYVKLANHVSMEVDRNTRKAKTENLPFMKGLEEEYQVTNLLQPFSSAQSNELRRVFRIDFNNIDGTGKLLKVLNSNPDVEYAEVVPVFYTTSIPNDEYYDKTLHNGTNSVNSSWHLSLINALGAWSITEGSQDIIVAVVDNAIWTEHPDLINKVVSKIDIAEGDTDPTPPATGSSWSHGTHVAGLVAAETNNGIGVASIGNKIKLMAVKAAKDDSDSRSLTSAMEGVVWAANNGAHIINMSFATDVQSLTMQNIMNYAYNKGCVLVGAAGNSGLEKDHYPAALDHVIAVGSCNENEGKSGFSNYGAWIDVLAPGGTSAATSGFSMLSTTYGESNVSAYGVSTNYGVIQGTSMASPVVAGLCGLMLSANPNLTPEKLTAMLKATCVNVDAVNTQYIGKIGSGRIDACAAVLAASNSISPLTANFKATSTYLNAERSVAFTDLSVGTPVSWSWTFEGGTPSTSNVQNPVVTYQTAGTYQVTLTVTDNDSNSDTETKTSYITVVGAGASAWTKQHTNLTTQSRGILYLDIVDEETVWALTYDGSITNGQGTKDFIRTINGGSAWQPGVISIADGFTPVGISATSGSKAWLIAFSSAGGGVFHTSDGGQTWAHQSSAAFNGATSFANVIHMFNENEGFCQGDPVNGKFEIYYTTNGGQTWTLVADADNPAILSGEAGWTGSVNACENTAWFGTNKGRVFKTSDKGKTWTAYSTGAEDATRISFADKNNGVLLCNISTNWKLLETSDGGETWAEIPVTNGYLSNVSAVPGTPGMLVGYKAVGTEPLNYYSAYSYDNGATWVKIDNGAQYNSVKMLDKETGWAGGFSSGEVNGGGIYKWPELTDAETPIFTSSPVMNAYKNQMYTYNITTIDLNNASLTITAFEKPSWLSFNDNGDGTATLTGNVPAGLEIPTHVNVFLQANNGVKTGFQNYVLTIEEQPVSLVQNPGIEIAFYPNPAQDFITISCKENTAYEIIDITGRILISGKMKSDTETINISKLSRGTFILKTKSDSKLIIKSKN